MEGADHRGAEGYFRASGSQLKTTAGEIAPALKLMRVLEAAAHEFWSTYDPDDRSTVTFNHVVSDWLQKEHRIPKRMAETMATILRADDLPNRISNGADTARR